MESKTLRWGPIEGPPRDPSTGAPRPLKFNKDGFLEGTYDDIPDETHLRVESLPGRMCVYDGTVSHAVTLTLDPGRYAYTMKKDIFTDIPGQKQRCYAVGGEFLVGCTSDNWAKLGEIRPQNVTTRMTSDGPRWFCAFPGCKHAAQTRLAAVLHENRVHYGIDPLADPGGAKKVEMGTARPKQAAAGPVGA